LGGCCEIFLAISLEEDYRAEARNQHSTIVINKRQLYGRESFSTLPQQRAPEDIPWSWQR
jgi:hypothetical protein